MKYKTVFVTDRGDRHQQVARDAAPAELTVVMLRRPAREELLHQLADADFFISERSGVIDAELIAAAPRLRLIQRLGSLYYDIDLAAARAAGVPVCVMPVRPTIMVAEHMVMQMLALAKHLLEVSAIAQAAGAWDQVALRTDENTFAYNWSARQNIGGILERTVGILGFGEIGAELARRLRGFSPALVRYHKRRRLPESVEAELNVVYAGRDELLAESDFVCNLLPYFPETDHALDAQVFAQMKPGAFLVSCGSGSVIDETALAAALRAGHLGGAALDTFEWEPLTPDNPLLPLARDPHMNVLLTPHTGAGTVTPSVERRRDYENIRRILQGRPLLYRVDIPA